MSVYLDAAAVLNFLVDFLLLMGTNRITGYRGGTKRAVMGAALGGIYGALTLVPGFFFLGNAFWKIVFLVLMALLGFGIRKSAARRCALFVFLCLALGGLAEMVHTVHFQSILVCCGGIYLLCRLGFNRKDGTRNLLPCCLRYGGKEIAAVALMDTGNELRDPITGEQVLVAGAQIGEKLLGFSRQQLARPVNLLGSVPKARLIPYRTVGSAGDMMLAVRMDHVQVGKWIGKPLVAFSPENMSGEYQLLTGGVLQ